MINLFCAILLIFTGTQIFLYFQSPIAAAVNLVSLCFMFYLTDDIKIELDKFEKEKADSDNDNDSEN